MAPGAIIAVFVRFLDASITGRTMNVRPTILGRALVAGSAMLIARTDKVVATITVFVPLFRGQRQLTQVKIDKQSNGGTELPPLLRPAVLLVVRVVDSVVGHSYITPRLL